mmetsp:Transcript_58792/g.94993  ORF Transcript_58792/g.94993 Transcript_58792/m.94993 type:complete len:110 (+) Transcript_58792:215-544(+)
MELYGKLRVAVLQSTIPASTPCPRGLWMYGMNREDPTAECKMWWARGALDQCEADRATQECRQRMIQVFQDIYVNPPPPRTEEDLQQPSYDKDSDDDTPSEPECLPAVF